MAAIALAMRGSKGRGTLSACVAKRLEGRRLLANWYAVTVDPALHTGLVSGASTGSAKTANNNWVAAADWQSAVSAKVTASAVKDGRKDTFPGSSRFAVGLASQIGYGSAEGALDQLESPDTKVIGYERGEDWDYNDYYFKLTKADRMSADSLDLKVYDPASTPNQVTNGGDFYIAENASTHKATVKINGVVNPADDTKFASHTFWKLTRADTGAVVSQGAFTGTDPSVTLTATTARDYVLTAAFDDNADGVLNAGDTLQKTVGVHVVPNLVSVTADKAAVDEAGDDATRTVTYTVTRTGTLTGELNVAIARSGTAAGGEDYDTPAAFLTTARILNGQTSVTFAAAVRKDNAVEPTETLRLTLAAGSNYGVDASKRSTTTTVSDDPPVVSLEKVQDGSEDPDPADTSATPGPMPAKFRVTRTGGKLDAAIDIDFSLDADGDHAASANDFEFGVHSVYVRATGEIVVPVKDDDKVEFREHFKLTLAGEGSKFLLAQPGDETKAGEVKDNDFEIKLITVSFNDQGVARDTGTQARYPGTQWLDADFDGKSDVHGLNIADSEYGYPLSYYPIDMERASENKDSMHIESDVKMSIACKDDAVEDGLFAIAGDGSGPGGGHFKDFAIFPDVMLLDQVGDHFEGSISAKCISDTFIPRKIANDVLSISWTLTRSTAACAVAYDAGTSKNRIYVTGAQVAEQFETVLDIACSGANGKVLPDSSDPLTTQRAQASQIVDAVWSQFGSGTNAPKNPKTVDGRQLRFWGPSLDEYHPYLNNYVSSFLKDADGRCGNWANFLVATLNTCGIVGVGSVDATVKNNVQLAPDNNPPADSPAIALDVGTRPAQGDAHPSWHLFPQHSVVRITGFNSIFDPSYGARFDAQTIDAAKKDWEDASVVEIKWFYVVGMNTSQFHYEAGESSVLHEQDTTQIDIP